MDIEAAWPLLKNDGDKGDAKEKHRENDGGAEEELVHAPLGAVDIAPSPKRGPQSRALLLKENRHGKKDGDSEFGDRQNGLCHTVEEKGSKNSIPHGGFFVNT